MPQEQQYPASLLVASPISPSFNSYYTSYSSDDETLADIAARVVQELSGDSEFYSWEDEESVDLEQQQHDEEEEAKEIIQTTAYGRDDESNRDQSSSDDDEEEEEEGEFEFAVVDREAVTSPISADEIFYNGQIRPLYPLFNTDLLLDGPQFQSFKSNLNNKSTPPPAAAAAAVKSKVVRRQPLMKLFREEEREGGDDSSSEDELDSIPEGTYCVWKPKKEESSPEICKKKSSSDGADSKRWKLFKDLIYRSNSDGNHKRSNRGTGIDDRRQHGGAEEKELKAGDDGAEDVQKVKESEKRSSFRPIRQDLVGVLANVSGVSRNLHPF